MLYVPDCPHVPNTEFVQKCSNGKNFYIKLYSSAKLGLSCAQPKRSRGVKDSVFEGNLVDKTAIETGDLLVARNTHGDFGNAPGWGLLRLGSSKPGLRCAYPMRNGSGFVSYGSVESKTRVKPGSTTANKTSQYSVCKGKMARPGRLELPTLCLEGRCSIQLSYGRLY
jgi:hypothetical protein